MATIIKRNNRSTLIVALSVGAIGLAAALWQFGDFQLRDNSSSSSSLDQLEPETTSRRAPDKIAKVAEKASADNSKDQEADSSNDVIDSELEDSLRWARNEATKDVHLTYSMMFDQLGLAETQRDALSDFLVEVAMSSTYMRGYRPVPIEESDRRAGIAAIVGDDKLEQLLTLERNRAEYTEAKRIDGLMRRHDSPMTKAQVDRMLEILIHVRGREQAVANRNAEPGTIEAIESQMATMDEYERLVMELAPSVLSAEQTRWLYERYQSLSYRRAQILEMQKRPRANDTDEDDVPLGYPPRT